jgi:hypothetical protein
MAHVEWILMRFNEMHVNVRFENIRIRLPSYAGYSTASQHTAEVLQCDDNYAIPHSPVDTTDGFVPDKVSGVLEAVPQARLGIFLDTDEQIGLHNSTRAQNLFTLLNCPIFELLVWPKYAVMAGRIHSQFERQNTATNPHVIGSLTITVSFQTGAIVEIPGMEVHMCHALGMRPHGPASVVLPTAKVMSVLSEDFSTRKHNDGATTAAFFRQVVIQVPDAILTTEIRTMHTVSQNGVTERIFGEGIVGMDINDFFGSQ